MLELEFPWLLAVLPLPLLLRWLLPPYAEQRESVRVPFFNRLVALSGREPGRGSVIAGRNWFQWLLAPLVWILLVAAAAGPVWVEDPITKIESARDLMLLVDLSGSMEARDFTDRAGDRVDRLTAVKEVLDDFLTRREGDRVGLIVFGNAAFVQVPFTQDLEATRTLLDETAVRMAGPRTAFGDAIGLAITLFERSDVERRVIIALTDGNDTGSKVPPAQAAKIARDKDIVIHVVGVGDAAATGEEKLDEEALNDVASLTDGRYFYAADRDELEEIYAELDRIDSREVEAETYRPRTDLFHWPLAAFLVLGLLFHAGLLLRSDGEASHG